MAAITQKQFDTMLMNALNNVRTVGSADLASRSNLKFLTYSPVAGAGLQLAKISLNTLLTEADPADIGYSIYEMSVTQTGTDAPTKTETVDDLGITVTPARAGAGVYTFTSGTAAFVAGTTVEIFNNNATPCIMSALVATTSVIRVYTFDDAGVAADALLSGTKVVIKVPAA